MWARRKSTVVCGRWDRSPVLYSGLGRRGECHKSIVARGWGGGWHWRPRALFPSHLLTGGLSFNLNWWHAPDCSNRVSVWPYLFFFFLVPTSMSIVSILNLSVIIRWFEINQNKTPVWKTDPLKSHMKSYDVKFISGFETLNLCYMFMTYSHIVHVFFYVNF